MPERHLQPPKLLSACKNAGVSFESLDCLQLIVVMGNGSTARISCYEKDRSNIWCFNPVIDVISGHIGKNGLCETKTEGDGCTPIGCFKVGYAFGFGEKPDTAMYYRNITSRSYWVDDPLSRFYNRWVEGSENAAWNHAEFLWRYRDAYLRAVVIEYNTASPSPGKGSAIFLHCGDEPTSGCVAVSETDLLKLLKWLEPGKAPYILLSPS